MKCGLEVERSLGRKERVEEPLVRDRRDSAKPLQVEIARRGLIQVMSERPTYYFVS